MHEDLLAYSGVQLIYHSEFQDDLEFLPHTHCRICGGPLTKNPVNADKISLSWTDEAICEAKESNHICKACDFMTTGTNHRTPIWHSHKCLASTPDQAIYMDYHELFAFLQQDFPCPTVIQICGPDPKVLQKHVQWKANHAITYDRKNVRIAFSNFQIFGGAKVDCILDFSADHMVKTIMSMMDIAKKEICPRMVFMKSNYQRANFICSALYAAYEHDHKANLQTLFACWLTGQVMYPLEPKIKPKENEKEESA